MTEATETMFVMIPKEFEDALVSEHLNARNAYAEEQHQYYKHYQCALYEVADDG